jgi:hypothetical protein
MVIVLSKGVLFEKPDVRSSVERTPNLGCKAPAVLQAFQRMITVSVSEYA